MTKLNPGQYHGPTGIGLSTTTPADGAIRVARFQLTEPQVFDKLGFEIITTAGSTGSVCMGVIYADNGSDYPGDLVIGTPTIVTETTGVKEPVSPFGAGLMLRLPVGVYWVGAVSQGNPTTKPVFRSFNGQAARGVSAASSSTAFANALAGWELTGATTPGTVPASSTAWSGTTSPVRTLLRAI